MQCDSYVVIAVSGSLYNVFGCDDGCCKQALPYCCSMVGSGVEAFVIVVGVL